MNTVDVAKDIVFLCRKYKLDFNNTKVQKLLYLFIGFCLVNDVKDVSVDELPQAWQYGPVMPTVYNQYDRIIREIDDSTYSISIKDEKTINILEATVQVWGRVSASKLSDWSHKPNSPWDIIRRKYNEKEDIPLDLIYSYFSENVENVLDEAAGVGFFGFRGIRDFIKKNFS